MLPFTLNPSRERADCSVRALSACLNVPYEVAHANLAVVGRKPRRIIKWTIWTRSLDVFGLEMNAEFSCMTLAKALPQMSAGRYICRVEGHLFAVVNGVVHDHRPPAPGRRILMTYQPKI